MDTEKRICEHCKNFYRHYAMAERRFVPVDCGHCARDLGHSLSPYGTCEYWESGEEKNRTRRLRIEESLVRMSADLHNICELILANEKPEG